MSIEDKRGLTFPQVLALYGGYREFGDLAYIEEESALLALDAAQAKRIEELEGAVAKWHMLGHTIKENILFEEHHWADEMLELLRALSPKGQPPGEENS